jgi:hypothetical protein
MFHIFLNSFEISKNSELFWYQNSNFLKKKFFVILALFENLKPNSQEAEKKFKKRI